MINSFSCSDYGNKDRICENFIIYYMKLGHKHCGDAVVSKGDIVTLKLIVL